ncbi:MAG: type II toxin-antitoxin system VapC family toxin [Candidatus Aminicenantes bacterium]|nr:type II toxin-antitoxin system VapC family toxin [Candidatus Aminicenantes bacterium]
MSHVLDAHALMAFLEKEPGFDKVAKLFAAAADNDESMEMTAVNYGEVVYGVLREYGQPRTNEVEAFILTLPVRIVAADIELAREAARFKARYKIAYADCFAAALSRLRRVPLLTGDGEFRALEKEIAVTWL